MMVKIKIWTQTQLNKGYIPSDKITRRGIKFEIYGLENFDNIRLEHGKIKRMIGNFNKINGDLKDVIEYIKGCILESDKYKNMKKEDYHTHIYLNINYDGVDCFISR